MFIPKAQEIYRHFKGNLYQILAVAEHSETAEKLVVYQALYGEYKVYARPLEMFLDKVDKVKYPDVAQEYRFELQNGEDPRLKETGTVTAVVKEINEPQSTQENEQENVAGNMQEILPENSQEEELNIDPMVLEFLDADSYEARLNILAGLRHRITDEMLTPMAIVCDIELPEGDVMERYEALRASLITKDKYECSRMR